ncbi:hypothetical protein GGI23_000902 [Coemansia sp. RSA 2559]|nr:hypothetical protein GGI23_000902 [Coemansia sp. RSA 2559]KAJ2868582.1 hypothetical protein GGI22_000797 [Coemansia erecta]
MHHRKQDVPPIEAHHNITKPSSQQGMLVIAEYPLAGDDIDQGSVPQRPGVTYTRTVVLVPSDRRLILIPSTVPVPTSDPVTAFLLALPNDPNNVANADASIGAAAHIPAVMTGGGAQPVLFAPNDQMEEAALVSGEFGSYTVIPSSNAAQTVTMQSGFDVLGAEHPGDSLATEWMMTPAIIEATHTDVGCRHYIPRVGTPAAATSYPEDGSHNIYESDGQLCSDSPSTNTGRSSQQPQQQYHPAADSTKGSPSSSSKKRPCKDPDTTDMERPKKPRNSFFYFRCQFHKLKNAGGERIKAKNISAQAADEWNSMSDEDRDIYKKMADKDTLRYKREMKRYKELSKQDAKKPKAADSTIYHVATPSRGLSSSCSAKVSQPATTPASLSAGLDDSTTGAIDISSFLSATPTVAPADTVHVHPLFNEPQIISIDHNAASSSGYSAHTFTIPSVDYSGQQSVYAIPSVTPLAAVSASPLVYPYVSSSPNLPQPQAQMQVYPHPSAINQGIINYIPTAQNQMHQHQIQQHQIQPHRLQQHQQHQQQLTGNYQHTPILSAAYSHSPDQLQQSWQELSSLLNTVNSMAPSTDNLASSAAHAALSQSTTPQLQPQSHSHLHMHQQQDQQQQLQQHMPETMVNNQFPMLSGQQGLELTSGTPLSVNRSRANTTPNSLARVLSAIPEIEIIDTSNTVSLPTYSIPRHN